ncbi:MAG: sigma-54-dependent Fis family transcriptional regulator [Deltaproteobacteria bacterium]|nr:sigma-54-dependent Fis family transcriptional regulator [Deltaproteobacteria bacterium]MBW1913518.1 sigma-54-dependent Fis family transcriptional regulator [Deltaproteobacteria bacterium]
MNNETHHILVIDDEVNICQNCVKILSRSGYQVKYALNGYAALEMLADEQFSVVVTDLKMSSLGGMEVLRRIKDNYPDTMVIVITGYATVSSAVEVMKMGGFDYLSKPFTPDELRSTVLNAITQRDIRIQSRRLHNQQGIANRVTHQLVGESRKINDVIKMVGKVGPTDSTVLICGESGTGKELIARAIHANSKRKDRVFFAVDCGTLSTNLLESELFGYTKGAFTGATTDKEGIFRRAHKGTVFLDEISNVNPEVQGKLLRFLENQEFLPIGSTSVQKVDIRIVLATNRDLMDMVKRGTFREDFYYRIFVYPIMIPPLRERKEDILPIAYHFLDLISRSMGKKVIEFDDKALQRLQSHDWPGNVRQLRNVIERAVILCEKNQVGIKELSPLGDDMGQLVDYVPSTNEELKQIKSEIRQKSVVDVEKRFVLKALVENQWNVTCASKKVGLQRSNFQKLMKKHHIILPQDK